MKNIGLLISSHFPPSVGEETVRLAARSALEELGIGGRVRSIPAEDLSKPPRLDLLISLLGDRYPENTWPSVAEVFDTGGVILSLGPRPFTVPYSLENGAVHFHPPSDRAMHSIGFVDTFVSTGRVEDPGRSITTPRYAFIESLIREHGCPVLGDVQSMNLRLALGPARPDDLYASRGRVEARFEAGWVVEDQFGRRMHCPLARLDHFSRGSLVFANFRPEESDFYEKEFGRRLLAGLVRTSLDDRLELDMESGFARYYPGETATVRWKVDRLGPVPRDRESRPERRSIRVDLLSKPGPAEPVRSRRKKLDGFPCEGAARFRDLPSGRYSASATVLEDGRPVLREWTGFYVLSDRDAGKVLSSFPRIGTDPKKAPDYLLRDGRPMPMHGTTYMVRGRYRDCFQNVNVHVCDEDMARLREAGVNILRTGLWTGYEALFHDSGRFRERTLRSLDGYFLTAARHGLPVQFAFAAFVMNHWDRSRDPVHDPVMHRRIRAMFRQFMDRYAGWPNVQVDIINEPSYAPYRDGDLWQIARPFGDAREKKAWVRWLRKTYGELEALREAWGVSARDLPRFEDAEVPPVADFRTNYDGASDYDGRPRIQDFMAFARESFSKWVRMIRDIVKDPDPEMPVMVGRDETIRVPTQQDDACLGSIDLVNWHQWHREGLMFVEYVLNRTRGLPCCGQEMGILPYKDQQNEERLSELDRRDMLERKLLYSLGNWIQWQSHNDLTMDNVKETKLGLIRADGTEKPAMTPVRCLSWLEDRMAPRLTGRREDLEDIVIVHPSSLHFSSDHSLAYRAAMQCILALHYHLDRQAVLVLEHLFRPDNRKQVGDPALVIFPSPTILREETWEYLLELAAERGKTVVVSGQVDRDEHWRPADRFSRLGLWWESRTAATSEPLRIGGKTHFLSFRDAIKLALPGKAFGKNLVQGMAGQEVLVHRVGKGTLIYCPLPVELADSIDPTVALYRQAMELADAAPPVFTVERGDRSPAHLIYPVRYRACTAYTVVNEGPDAVIRFRDGRSGVRVGLEVARERGAKLYLDRSGRLLGAYAHRPLTVGDAGYDVKDTTAFVRKGSRLGSVPAGPVVEKKTARKVRAAARGIEQ